MGEAMAVQWSVEFNDGAWVARNNTGASWRVPASAMPQRVVEALLGAILGVAVAEHHLLAAHGEGLFSGLDYSAEAWAGRLRVLLGNLERFRVIVEEWPEGHMMVSRTELKTRGWTEAAILELITPAAILPNPHYAGGGDMVLFDTRRVFAAEATQTWMDMTAQMRSQRAFRAWQPTADRASRKRARELAALDPGRSGEQLAVLAAVDDSPAVRGLAIDALNRHWRDHAWSAADLCDASVALIAVHLGGPDVIAAALGDADPLVARVAAERVIEVLAG